MTTWGCPAWEWHRLHACFQINSRNCYPPTWPTHNKGTQHRRLLFQDKKKNHVSTGGGRLQQCTTKYIITWCTLFKAIITEKRTIFYCTDHFGIGNTGKKTIQHSSFWDWKPPHWKVCISFLSGYRKFHIWTCVAHKLYNGTHWKRQLCVSFVSQKKGADRENWTGCSVFNVACSVPTLNRVAAQ